MKKEKSTKPTFLTKKGRQARFLESFGQSPFNISTACANARIHRSTYYIWLKGKRFADAVLEIRESKKDLIEEALMDLVIKRDNITCIFAAKTLCKDRGYVEARPKDVRQEVSVEAQAIIDELITGEIDAPTAAFRFDKLGLPLPAGLEAVLKRTIMPEPDEPEEEGLSDDALENLYRQRINNVEEQKEVFLPKRKQEVEEMKTELKGADTFSKEATEAGIGAK